MVQLSSGRTLVDSLCAVNTGSHVPCGALEHGIPLAR